VLEEWEEWEEQVGGGVDTEHQAACFCVLSSLTRFHLQQVILETSARCEMATICRALEIVRSFLKKSSETRLYVLNSTFRTHGCVCRAFCAAHFISSL